MMIYIYLFCGFVSSGFVYNELQKTFPEMADEDRVVDSLISLLFILIGFIGLPIVYLCKKCDGWKMPFTR